MRRLNAELVEHAEKSLAFLLCGLGGLCVVRVLFRLVGAFPPDALLFQLGIWRGAIYNLAADYGENRYRAAALLDPDSHIVLWKNRKIGKLGSLARASPVVS